MPIARSWGKEKDTFEKSLPQSPSLRRKTRQDRGLRCPSSGTLSRSLIMPGRPTHLLFAPLRGREGRPPAEPKGEEDRRWPEGRMAGDPLGSVTVIHPLV